jgi:hypothetical protein
MFSEVDLSNDTLSLVIKGQVLEYSKNTFFFMSIDLSCNRLVGQIPQEIYSLTGLINLNLSSIFVFWKIQLPDIILIHNVIREERPLPASDRYRRV